MKYIVTVLWENNYVKNVFYVQVKDLQSSHGNLATKLLFHGRTGTFCFVHLSLSIHVAVSRDLTSFPKFNGLNSRVHLQ